jgi:hypothetical protein
MAYSASDRSFDFHHAPKSHKAGSLRETRRDSGHWGEIRDIVSLYLDQPDRALVLCVDEKSQILVLEPTPPLLQMRPDQVERPLAVRRRGCED